MNMDRIALDGIVDTMVLGIAVVELFLIWEVLSVDVV